VSVAQLIGEMLVLQAVDFCCVSVSSILTAATTPLMSAYIFLFPRVSIFRYAVYGRPVE